MKRILVFYGYFDRWDKMYNRDELIPYIHELIDDVILMKDIDSLKKYLLVDGIANKNYIMPSQVNHIHELNEAGIKSMITVNSEQLRFLEDKKSFAYYVHRNRLTEFFPKYYNKFSDRKGDQLVILKPRDSTFSYGIYKKKLCEVEDWEFSNHVIQEYIYDNKEYDGVIVANKGEVTFGFAYVCEFDTDNYIKFQNEKPNFKSIKKIMMDDKIKSMFSKILKPCLYTGTCCFDYKVKNDKLYVFEINPRLDGALASPWNKDNLGEVIRESIKIYDADNN